MAKSKYAPALFEMMSKQKQPPARRSGLPLPRWWKDAGKAEAPGSTVSVPKPQTPAEPPDHQTTGGPIATVTAASPVATPVVAESQLHVSQEIAPARRYTLGSPGRNMASVSDGRFELSLNWIGLVAVAGCVLLAMFCSYQLGRRAGLAGGSAVLGAGAAVRDPSLDEVAAVREGPPDPSVVNLGSPDAVPSVPPRTAAAREGQAPGPERKSSASAGAGGGVLNPDTRVKGLNYIVVERFRVTGKVKNLDEARADVMAAQKWLRERCNLPTAIYECADGYELWTTQGFKLPEQKRELDELAERIRSYGRQYAKENRYLFQCEARRHK